MATQPLGEANQQLWWVPFVLGGGADLRQSFFFRDDTLTRLLSENLLSPLSWHRTEALLDLSTATVKRNAELENRVAELEVELSVWKQAHSVALEASERETKAHNVQVAALNRQISNLDCFRGVRCSIIDVIDIR